MRRYNSIKCLLKRSRTFVSFNLARHGDEALMALCIRELRFGRGLLFRPRRFLFCHASSSQSGNRICRGSTYCGLRYFQRFGGSRLGRCFCPSATSRLIGEPLAFDAFKSFVGACNVVEAELDAVIIAEIELRNIPLQVRL